MNKSKLLQFLENLQSFILLLPMFSFSILQPCLCAATAALLPAKMVLIKNKFEYSFCPKLPNVTPQDPLRTLSIEIHF